MSMHLPAPFRRAAAVLLAAAMMPFVAVPATAQKIQKIVSPSGIEFWLVRDSTVPLVAIDFAFRGGSAQDPKGKSGVANMVASLLDEGAGELDDKAVHARLERKAIEL
ncbi:MAG: insulinase family protein, partial [Rhodospirillales bacterium]|nr:insulinase family protein [Rhodospirillales bacterium]